MANDLYGHLQSLPVDTRHGLIMKAYRKVGDIKEDEKSNAARILQQRKDKEARRQNLVGHTFWVFYGLKLFLYGFPCFKILAPIEEHRSSSAETAAFEKHFELTLSKISAKLLYILYNQ